MKKKYFFAACVFLIVFVIGSCSSIWRKVIHGNGLVTTQVRSITSDYRKIRSHGSFDVVLISDTKDSITIEAEENIIPYILTEIKNGILTIKFQEDVSIETIRKLQVTVPVQSINEISVYGSGNIKSKNVITSDDVSFYVKGSGDINVKVNAENVSISVKGSGDVYIEGKTNTLDVDIMGSGDIHAYNLASDVVKATVHGSGNIETTVNNELNANISGSGDIFYKGTPSKFKTNVQGSGKIEQKY